MNRYEQTHFSNLPEYNYTNDFETILDSSILAPDDATRALKIEHQR